MPDNVYTLHKNATVSTAITVLQIATSTTRPIEILRAWCSQSASTTSTQPAVGLVKKTGAATVTAAIAADFMKHNPSAANCSCQLGTGLSGYTGTAEGTDGDIIYSDGFNILGNWLYLPVPEERWVIPASAFIALKFLVAPPSATYRYGITFRELG